MTLNCTAMSSTFEMFSFRFGHLGTLALAPKTNENISRVSFPQKSRRQSLQAAGETRALVLVSGRSTCVTEQRDLFVLDVLLYLINTLCENSEREHFSLCDLVLRLCTL